MFSQDPAATLDSQLLPFKDRASERHVVRLMGQVVLPQTGETLDVWIRDLSEHGFRFVISKKLEVGAKTKFKVKKNAAVSGLNLIATVIYCNVVSEHCWHGGCQFTEPLQASLLDYFIR